MTKLVRRRLSSSALMALATACLTLWPTVVGAQVPTFKIDHFWCYSTTFQPVGRQVRLQDQFDQQISPTFRETAIVRRPVRFCNPVSKILESTGQFTPIRNEASHLKLYRIWVDDTDLAPIRKVRIENQFGIKTIQTFQQEVLAVPSEKNNEGPHHDLDHFKCYRAYGGSINRLVTLRDQFQAQQGLKVTYPFLFCNPTLKIHSTVTTQITNREDHLTCYLVTRRPFSGNVATRNQFGVETLVVSNPDLLCVPSKKLKVS